MQPLGDSSIRQKLTRIVLLTCGAAILLACTVFAVYDLTTFRTSLARELATVAEITGSNTTAALAFSDARSARETLGSLSALPHIVEACIYTRDGKVFAKYVRRGSNPGLTPPEVQPDGATIASDYMVLFRQIRLNEEQVGTIYLKSDLAEVRQRTFRFAGITLGVILASFITAYLLASRLQRVISEPILELARTAFTVSAEKNYSIRATKRSEDEIGFLFDRFNEMLEQIQQRENALQWARDELEVRVDERTRELQKEIIDRKQAERELDKQKTFLNSLIDHNPLAIVAADADRTVRMCNPAFERMFQYQQSEILGRTLSDLVAKGELKAEALEAANENRLGRTVHKVSRRTRNDGSLVDVEIFGVPIPGNDDMPGSLVLFQDITERKMAETALMRAKEDAEAANRAKSEFLANMSHEIRTPMNGILGMTELVLDTMLDPDQRNYLNLAKISADSLLSLLNDILDYSKIEAGKLEIDAIDFNIGDSLGDTMKTLSLRAHQKGLELAFEIEPDVPQAVVGDPGRLRQIIVNLVGNAIKFTEKGEVVTYVKTESRTESEIWLLFTVADTGIGIPADKQAAIFKAFEQADGSMTRKYGGTGLGLTISLRLVQLMDGRIWVESAPGQGSRFHFTIRFALQKVSARTVVPRDPATLRDMPVLIVDDNATNREILRKMLENWHMQPTVSASGAQAMVTLRESMARGRGFPLILLDAQMPEMDGFALAESIKRNPDWSSATVMMLSSAGQPGDAMRCRSLGVVAYLTKPIVQSELFDAILSALGTRAKNQVIPALVTRHSLRESRHHFHVLLAEDNAVNQTLAVRLLEKNGHTVTVAENGRQALEALEKQSYDLILMDIQMPEMNGWEATRAIREREKTTGAHMPIVAMTAHAMKGDKERCLAAGMDAYLTKPINTQQLFATLDRFGGQKAGPDSLAARPSKVTSREAIDLAGALERVEGDRELLAELARLFASECPRSLTEMRQARESGDAHRIELLAHAMKGSSASLCANRVSSAAFELETHARAEDMANAGALIESLEREVEQVLPELESLLRKVPE
jgi:two-component system sensor histidine kinase/response regulator